MTGMRLAYAFAEPASAFSIRRICMNKKSMSKQLAGVALVTLFGTVAVSASAQADKSATGASKESQAGKTGATEQKDAGGASSGAAKSAGATLSKADENLMRQIAQTNLAEIEAGKVALSKTQNDSVKTFAQKMIDDHTTSQQEVQQLAQAKGVTLPTEPDKQHKDMLKKMSGLSGETFDRRYVAQGGLEDHKKAHALLQRVETRAKDPDLKALAGKTLPVVDQHLVMAQRLKDATGPAKRPAQTSGSSGGGTSGGTGMPPSGAGTSPGGAAGTYGR
jgi:putative membrane protein